MTKYAKAITVNRLRIAATDKDSFDECNKAILAELELADVDEQTKNEIKRIVLNES
jgi:hypothetical protein